MSEAARMVAVIRDERGHLSAEIDGEPIEGLIGIAVSARSGEAAEVTLVLHGSMVRFVDVPSVD